MSCFVNNTARLLPIRLIRRGKFSTWVLGVWVNTTEVAWLDYLCETDFPWRKGIKFDMPMYPEHLWNWLPFGHSLLIFLIWAEFWLSERCQIGSFQTIIENAWEEWAEICHAYVSWPPSELIRIWSSYVDFPNLFINALWFCVNLRSADLFVHLYHVISEKWRRQILAHENYLVTERGYTWLVCSQTLSCFI